MIGVVVGLIVNEINETKGKYRKSNFMKLQQIIKSATMPIMAEYSKYQNWKVKESITQNKLWRV